jgi:hypothetical protein
LSNFVEINADLYYNCKIILNMDETHESKKLLTNMGMRGEYYFSSASLPYSGQNINISNIPFTFPTIAFDKYDSICCEGQVLQTEEDNYQYVHILATAVWGNYPEKLKIIYSDDSSIDTEIYFKDWYFGETDFEYDKFNCLIALKGFDITSFRKYIYYHKCILPASEKKIKGFELPYNPDIFVISVTIEK